MLSGSEDSSDDNRNGQDSLPSSTSSKSGSHSPNVKSRSRSSSSQKSESDNAKKSKKSFHDTLNIGNMPASEVEQLYNKVLEVYTNQASLKKSKSRSKSKSAEKSVSQSRESSRSRSRSQERLQKSISRSASPRQLHSKKHSKKHERRSRSGSYQERPRRSRSNSYSQPRRSDSFSRARRSRSRSGSPPEGTRLHVAELDVDTRKRDLEHIFERYGKVQEIWMARNPPCFAFVVFRHKREAERALRDTNGMVLNERRIKVTMARPRVRGGRIRTGFDPNLRCFQCGELGHFSRNCTDTKFGYKRPPTPPGFRRKVHKSRSRSRSPLYY